MYFVFVFFFIRFLLRRIQIHQQNGRRVWSDSLLFSVVLDRSGMFFGMKHFDFREDSGNLVFK